MVEGPGCKVNGERLAKIKGQQVKRVSGSKVDKQSNSTSTSRKSVGVVIGCFITGIETLGKELFIHCGEYCIRVHFLMNGALRLSSQGQNNKSKSELTLSIELSNDTVTFYESAVDIRVSEECHAKVLRMQDVDICSKHFSFTRAASLVTAQNERMLCDVLLDQDVLPGVGNIIKNEALFDSGLHPALKVSSLSTQFITHLLNMTRDFSMLFYRCRKTGDGLSKYCKIYKKENCQQCRGRITTCRLGDNGRMTYFCSNCQTSKPDFQNIRLPSKNSLIGWVRDNINAKWTCSVCTLINSHSRSVCEVCSSPKPDNARQTKDNVPQGTKGVRKAPAVSNFSVSEPPAKRSRTEVAGGKTQAGAQHAQHKSRTTSKGEGPLPSQQPGPCSQASASTPSCSRPGEFSGSHLTVKARTFSQGISVPNRIADSVNRQPNGDKTPPVCPKHNKSCVTRKVVKKGENHGRPFYACSMPRDKQCGFFKWADLNFPVCSGHGKRCKIHTVLKLGPNNGRSFFTCPLEKGKQCNFFQWEIARGGP